MPQKMWKPECRDTGGTSWHGAPDYCSCGAARREDISVLFAKFTSQIKG